MKKIFKTLILFILLIYLTGCKISSGDSNNVSSYKNNPTNITTKKIYKFEMVDDDAHYLKFTPATTDYYSLMLGNNVDEDCNIEVYSDQDYTNKLKESYINSNRGDFLTFRAKKGVNYFIKIVKNNTKTYSYYYLLLSKTTQNNLYTKSNPLEFTLDKSEVGFISSFNYDDPNNDADNGNDIIYMVINSKITKELYFKTLQLNTNQDIDYKVYSDSNYTNEIYTTTSNDNTKESLRINFNTNTTYYLKIQNFTNDSDGLAKFSFDINDFE